MGKVIAVETVKPLSSKEIKFRAGRSWKTLSRFRRAEIVPTEYVLTDWNALPEAVKDAVADRLGTDRKREPKKSVVKA